MSKNIRFAGAIVVISALSLVPVAAAAQGRGQGKPKKVEKAEKKEEKAEHKAEKREDKKEDRRDDRRDIAVDRDAHVRVIHDYARAGSLPPGLAKRRALPPGLRAQLHERGELPPGLQKRLVAVPRPLITRLPPVPPYYHRYFAGDDLLVIDSRTHRIIAIIPDVWR
jgi:hypothetical protein